jgi:two-component system OmpR family response regulator
VPAPREPHRIRGDDEPREETDERDAHRVEPRVQADDEEGVGDDRDAARDHPGRRVMDVDVPLRDPRDDQPRESDRRRRGVQPAEALRLHHLADEREDDDERAAASVLTTTSATVCQNVIRPISATSARFGRGGRCAAASRVAAAVGIAAGGPVETPLVRASPADLTARSQPAERRSHRIHRKQWQGGDVNPSANGAASKILVVDDEPSIVDAVATALRYEGFEVREESTGRGAMSAAVAFDPDLVVLDWMLPDVEGIEVGRRLRDRGFETAILFLTAKDAIENKVDALRAGGDDYVTKPFSLAEVVARVQAILRRTGGDLPGDVLRFADLTLDEARHEVFRGDTRVDLTATEFSLLRYFLLNPRRVLSKGQILQNVWKYDFGGNSNVVETYVSYLRKKLDALGPPLIRTVRQAGYMLEAKE